MCARKRVLDALNHRQPDRVPLDIGATMCSGMHVSCVAALRDFYGLEKRPVKVHEPFQMLGLIEEDSKRPRRRRRRGQRTQYTVRLSRCGLKPCGSHLVGGAYCPAVSTPPWIEWQHLPLS